MGLISYGVSTLLSTATVLGLALTVQENSPIALPESAPVLELKSGANSADSAPPRMPSAPPPAPQTQTRSPLPPSQVLELVSGDSGKGQKRQKIKVSLAVERPEDLQVKEGDRVISGQILADQSSTRRALEQQRDQLLINLDQLAVPVAPIAELPQPDFAVEQAAIVAAKTSINSMDTAPTRNTRFIDPAYSDALDGDVREWNWQVKVKQVESRVELNRAIANLQRAESAYSWQQYQHGLNLQRQQETRQRQQFQVASLQTDLGAIEQKLQELGVVRSPYSGVVQRIKVLGQEGRMLKIELSLMAEQRDEGE